MLLINILLSSAYLPYVHIRLRSHRVYYICMQDISAFCELTLQRPGRARSGEPDGDGCRMPPGTSCRIKGLGLRVSGLGVRVEISCGFCVEGIRV